VQVPAGNLPLRRAYGSVAARPVLRRGLQVRAASSLRCGARLQPCSARHEVRALRAAIVARCESPTPSAKCDSEFFAHTAVSSSLLSAFLLPWLDPFGEPGRSDSPRKEELPSTVSDTPRRLFPG